MPFNKGSPLWDQRGLDPFVLLEGRVLTSGQSLWHSYNWKPLVRDSPLLSAEPWLVDHAIWACCKACLLPLGGGLSGEGRVFLGVDVCYGAFDVHTMTGCSPARASPKPVVPEASVLP